MQEVNISVNDQANSFTSSFSQSQTSAFKSYDLPSPSLSTLPSSIFPISAVPHKSVFFPPPVDTNSNYSKSEQTDSPVIDLTGLSPFPALSSRCDLGDRKSGFGEPCPILPYNFAVQRSVFEPTFSSFQRSSLSRLTDPFITYLLTSSKGPQATSSKSLTYPSSDTLLPPSYRTNFVKASESSSADHSSPSAHSFHSLQERSNTATSLFGMKKNFKESLSNMTDSHSSMGKFTLKDDLEPKLEIVNIDQDDTMDTVSETGYTTSQASNSGKHSSSKSETLAMFSSNKDSLLEKKTDEDLDEPNCKSSDTVLDSISPKDVKSRSDMYKTFQTWAIKNYGDSGKTKTVTRNKYRRIVRILSGEEFVTAENSKFRFWVKAKGFQLSKKTGDGDGVLDDGDQILLVPSKEGPDGRGGKSLKRVAVVENFFDIIYNVHVEMDGRGGKHAGQKRTYRAIAKTYSFLPREAVTRFLMSCTDCQKRMHLSLENNNDNKSINNMSSTDNKTEHTKEGKEHIMKNSSVIDYYMPITQTYLNQMRQSVHPISYDDTNQDDESMSSDSVTNRDTSPSPRTEEESMDAIPKPADTAVEEAHDMTSRKASPQSSDLEIRASESPIDMNSRKASPVSGKLIESKGHNERKRRASSESGDSAMTKTSEGKDDDDDDDNDDDDRIPVGHNIDPERLKSFNMFVRLFVDENLDRMVPISKQPKDKVQAILEACDRQFPEFHERSRKRIRTYLKSCRRMRRSKDHNGWEPLRPTPPHLTSAAAESLLATACENESQNAKRMRMGLEPLTAAEMAAQNMLATSQATPTTQQSTNSQSNTGSQTPSQPMSRPMNCSVPTATDFLRHQPHPTAFHPTPEFTPSFFTNGHGTAAALFRPGFPGYQHPAHHHPSVLQHASITPSANTNGEFGPTDLSMKKSNNKGQLSPSEVTAIKQLIAGYKESAAFLYRSADELEQLLLQQN